MLLCHAEEHFCLRPRPGFDHVNLGRLALGNASDEPPAPIRRVACNQALAHREVEDATDDGEGGQNGRRLLPLLELPPDVVEQIRLADLARSFAPKWGIRSRSTRPALVSR